MEFKKNMSCSNGTLISIMDLPSLLCIHCGFGNPLILKSKIHPCRGDSSVLFAYLFLLLFCKIDNIGACNIHLSVAPLFMCYA